MHRYFSAALIALLSLSIIGFAWITCSGLRFSYAVDYGEGPLVDQANRMLNHQAIYRADFSTPPYIVANYPPIYPLLMAGVSSLTGISPLLVGRIISLTAAVASAGILAGLGKALVGSKWAWLAATGIFLGHPYVLSWSTLARVDLLALFFCLAALSILYHHWHSWLWLTLALGLLLAAIYTRQSYILAGPMAAISWLWSRDRRRGSTFAVLLVTTVTLSFLVINSLTQNGFYHNIIQANINPYHLTILSNWLKQYLLIWPVFIVGILAYIGLCVAKSIRGIGTGNAFIMRGWLVFTFGSFLSALTVGKIGSGANYFLELIAAVSILSVVAFSRIRDCRTFIRMPLGLLICLQLVWLIAGSVILYQATYNKTWAQLERYDQMAQLVIAASDDGPVLTDDYLGLVVNANQAIYYQPFEFGQLYQAGLWDPQLLAEQIRQGYFPLILIGGTSLDKPCCWPPELVSAIQARYRIDHQSDVLICTPGQ
jgi:hypothetical protein